MKVEAKHLAYWKKKQVEQQIFNRKLAEKARSSLSKIVGVLVGEFGATKIILFGSLVGDRFGEGSDIDIAVAGVTRYDYFGAVAAVNDLTEFWIDLKPIEDLEPLGIIQGLSTQFPIPNSQFPKSHKFWVFFQD